VIVTLELSTFDAMRLSEAIAEGKLRHLKVSATHGFPEVSEPSRSSGGAPSIGTIKRLVFDEGFGFVAAGDGNEYFFHQGAGASVSSLSEGQAVEFEIVDGPKGPRAENVRKRLV
jgi:CspA family cold shock protein